MVKRFDNFIYERVREAYLYHNTSMLGIQRMIKDGKLGKSGWISFSRSPNYEVAPGAYAPRELRLVYDRDKLKTKYKTKPHADLLVGKSGGDWGDTVSGAESKWEAEERVKGPIPLEFGLVRIDITKRALESALSLVEADKRNAEFAKKTVAKAKEGYLWHSSKKEWFKPTTPRGIRRLEKNMKMDPTRSDEQLKESKAVLSFLKKYTNNGQNKI